MKATDHHTETSQLIQEAKQLTGFYTTTLAFNELK